MDLRRSDGVFFWDFLRQRQIPYQKEDFPFLTRDNPPKILPIMDFSNILTFDYAGEVVGYIYQKLGKSLSYIGPVVDSDFEYGFHNHSDKHTLWVGLQAVELLSRSGLSFDNKGRYDSKSEVLAVLAGMLHDIGNLVDRKLHSKYSIEILENLFYGKNDANEQEWRALIDAVKFHEEPVIIENHIKLEELTPLHWSLVIADKLHHGRDRVSQKSAGFNVSQRPFEHDVYVLLDSMIARSSWHIEGNLFVYQLDFSITEFPKRFENYLNNKERLWVPDEMYKDFSESGKTYRQSFIDLFIKVYQPRMDIAARAVFLLFPWLDSFEVRMSDNDVRGKVGSGLTSLIRLAKN